MAAVAVLSAGWNMLMVIRVVMVMMVMMVVVDVLSASWALKSQYLTIPKISVNISIPV